MLGILHGLVFLPVLLSLFCPWKLDVGKLRMHENNIKNHHNNNDEEELSDPASQDDHVFYQYEGYINCPCDFCDRFKSQ